tara:strand:+ start:318 stop:563 length:246 start_codon:yes stop_codon:yes gene_type:complete
MNQLSIILDDLDADERNQIVDLLALAGIHPSVKEKAAKYTYYIEIGLTRSNASALEGILKYVITYIYKGDQNEKRKIYDSQ